MSFWKGLLIIVAAYFGYKFIIAIHKANPFAIPFMVLCGLIIYIGKIIKEHSSR